MTEKIKLLREQLKSNEYKKLRKDGKTLDYKKFITPKDFVYNFRLFMERENPILFENDNFGFNHSFNARLTDITTNYTPNYQKVISQGFDAIRSQIRVSIEKHDEIERKEFGKAMLECLDIFTEYCEKCRNLAKSKGNLKLYNALSKIPAKGAESFYEALLFMKLCIFFLRSAFTNHLGLGRFDQYMYQFYLNDKNNGATDEELLEILEEFFISINRDTDLYPGIQQGDNGQSMVLGGFDKDGNDMYNELSQLIMEASLDLNLIDPKINLRVGKNTPDERYEFATKLTKQGLGFPQYCNDDVVIPGLIKLGYDEEDAYNYVVAACWEFIVPNCGADIPNIKTFDFPSVINWAIISKLERSDSFEELMGYVEKSIQHECDFFVEKKPNWLFPKKPVQSIFFDGGIESLKDILTGGTKYYNYGCHGTGIATAADSLAAVKKYVYDEKTITKEQLLKALAMNFEGYEDIRECLKQGPKMGNNDDYVDDIACDIMGMFSKYMNNRENGYGGIWRAGTGSAMEYILKGTKCTVTADGRKAGEPYSSSFSPALDAKTNGVLSVIQSFTKFDLSNIINGGPLTIEIHDTVLKNDEGVKKVAMLVKNYILLGGHQLQINSVNRERLIEAQKHPEDYPNLIVRVWGWSGYFNELDWEYQNHIIRRHEYMG